MTKKILLTQIKSDIQSFEQDNSAGLYNENPSDGFKAINRIWEKISEFLSLMLEEKGELQEEIQSPKDEPGFYDEEREVESALIN